MDQSIGLLVKDRPIVEAHLCSPFSVREAFSPKNLTRINGIKLQRIWIDLIHEVNQLELTVQEQIIKQQEIIESKVGN